VHDLRITYEQFVNALPPLPIELAAEPMLSLIEVSNRFQVSTKTITRWRYAGLQCLPIVVKGKRQLGFPLSAVENFARLHPQKVERGARFSHMSDRDKDAIILMARDMIAAGGNLTDICKTIADRLGRSTETIRYTITNFDRNHPDLALFPHRNKPLDSSSSPTIYDAFQEGHNVDLISKRSKSKRSGLLSVVNEVHPGRLDQPHVEYIPSAEFDNPDNHDLFISPMPGEEAFMEKVESMRAPKEVDASMAYLYEWPLLNAEQERHLFRKFNYLKHCLQTLQQSMNTTRPRAADLKKVSQLDEQIKTVRDMLIKCNLRLVHKLASQHLQGNQTLEELKSDAHISLMRAVEKFDYSRGFKFSTYATWAIVKNFARSIPDENTQRNRFVTGNDEILASRTDQHTDESEMLATAEQAKKRVSRLLQHLDPRTREVIQMRTGIDGRSEMTLEQIGHHFGITKERVRQINVRGMKQLRERAALEGEVI
jgi:RNA polymerase sigma factor (sigma-70 family)